MTLTAAYAIINCTLLLLICRPVAFNWDKSIKGGHCITGTGPYLSAAIISMSTDVIIVILPMPMLWGLQMPISKKLALTIIFGMGAL